MTWILSRLLWQATFCIILIDKRLWLCWCLVKDMFQIVVLDLTSDYIYKVQVTHIWHAQFPQWWSLPAIIWQTFKWIHENLEDIVAMYCQSDWGLQCPHKNTCQWLTTLWSEACNRIYWQILLVPSLPEWYCHWSEVYIFLQWQHNHCWLHTSQGWLCHPYYQL